MNIVSPFEQFKRVIGQLYPTVSNLIIDDWTDNVKPIQYYDGGCIRTEHPPVVSWRIGDKRFRYVLDPQFKTQHNNDFISIVSGRSSTTNIDYNGQEKVILDLIKWSVEGKSTEEMNDLLEIKRVDNERDGG
jgi:hypothetical protein